MAELNSLNHITHRLKNGGKVLVLNTGATINPEAEAMLQALHSRSIGGVDSHLQVLAEKGPEKFMSTYYVGYGHKSIGDCGSATIFIEGVSMLVAKAVQDWQLYSGQEASTRYIDFSTQPFVDPLGTNESKDILETWRKFYLSGLEELVPDLMKRFPKGAEEKDAIYEKAIKARAFDIMRGFLPSGATTNLAWHSNLRQIADKLLILRHHPLEEVREVAETIEKAVLEAFPSSFSPTRYEKTEEYNNWWSQEETYYSNDKCQDFALLKDSVDRELLSLYKDVLSKRPPKTELPRVIGECGTVQFEFLLDFGSFRDIQRHRAVIQRMPLVTTKFGFNEWYLSELTESLRNKALELFASQEKRIGSLDTTPGVKQYYTAMGYNLPNRITGNLPALVYLVELRATRFVHPTLRKRAIQMAEELTKRFADSGLVIHLDADPDRFDVRRGEHDIVRKDS